MHTLSLENTRILVLAEQMYEDLELWYPVLRFREEGAKVVIAGTNKEAYHGKHGYPVIVDTSVDQVSAENFDAVIIPGGYAPDHLRRFPAVLKLVREAFEQNKVVAAICHAGWVLISAGILKGRQITCFHAIKDDVINAGGVYKDDEVLWDGNLITSRQPSDLGAFCRTIITALGEQKAS
jgi:protease I